jgi:hypothetical protein
VLSILYNPIVTGRVALGTVLRGQNVSDMPHVKLSGKNRVDSRSHAVSKERKETGKFGTCHSDVEVVAMNVEFSKCVGCEARPRFKCEKMRRAHDIPSDQPCQGFLQDSLHCSRGPCDPVIRSFRGVCRRGPVSALSKAIVPVSTLNDE